jgi:hypothetical protein
MDFACKMPPSIASLSEMLIVLSFTVETSMQ